MSTNPLQLLSIIREQYVNSDDFNGLSVHALDIADPALVGAIIELINNGAVDLVRGDNHPNPHIKAYPADSNDDQIRKIKERGLEGCLYPTPKDLQANRVVEEDIGPYTRELAFGAPQLDYRIFDLRILEWYRNDPRYYYNVDDIHGTIHQCSGTEGPKGQILQDSLDFFEFGFAYNKELDRGVAAFLRYLHDLPAEQQTHLSNYQLNGEYQLHPDFVRTQLIGDFPERVSIYDAFLEEKKIINEMSRLMGKPPLFRSDNKAYERPAGFGILIRPTKKEYRDFSLQLDQLLSDDLNRDFFKGDIPTSEQLTREDGSKVTQSIGTIKLLEQWLQNNFRTPEEDFVRQLFKDIRFVRAERQKPAHKVDDNDFDQAYTKAQREQIQKAFNVVRSIRMILENHPLAKSCEVPDWLREAKVWVF